MSTKVVYVTGCLGFIGYHVAQHCLSKGWHVRGIDKCTYAANEDLLEQLEPQNVLYLNAKTSMTLTFCTIVIISLILPPKHT